MRECPLHKISCKTSQAGISLEHSIGQSRPDDNVILKFLIWPCKYTQKYGMPFKGNIKYIKYTVMFIHLADTFIQNNLQLQST